MKKNVLLFSMIVLISMLSGCNTGNQPNLENAANNAQNNALNTSMVDCTGNQNPSCFLERLGPCLPTTVKMSGTGGVEITLIVSGYVNEKCHFQRTVAGNSFLNLDCYFPKGTLNSNVLDQTFGNDHGLQKLVDESCNQNSAGSNTAGQGTVETPAETSPSDSNNNPNNENNFVLSEQPNQEKFNEYFTKADLGKLPLGVQVGPPNFPQHATTFNPSTDQLCTDLTIIKAISAGKLATATYDTINKKYVQEKSSFPMELNAGGSSGCETIGQLPGKYERKIYVDDTLAIVLPFEVQ